MLMDITSISRREEPSMNTSSSTSRKAKECSALPIFRKQKSRLETSSYSFPVNGIPTIHQVPRDGKAIGSDEEAYKTAQAEAAYAQQTMAGIVNHLIGKMYSLERNIILSKDSKHVDIINRARLRIRESLEDTLTIQEIAQELGISYSSFRKLFKEHTGFAPALYQQTLKLQRAKELLSTTDESIKEIAYRLNFESPDYFSAKFKSQTGMKPSDFRNTTR